MTTTYNLNNNKDPVIEQTLLTPFSMREAFSNWLSNGVDKEFSTQVSVACIDDISDYVKSKRIYSSLWEISDPSMFESVYQKIINAKILRIVKRNTYKVFTVVGQLYLKFLEEKPWMNTTVGLAMTFETNGTAQDDIKDFFIMSPGNKESSTVSKIIEDNYNANADVIQIIKDHDFKYVDNRDFGGALCVLGGIELSDIMKKINELGFHFLFKDGVSCSRDYKSAWYYKPNIGLDINEMRKREIIRNQMINKNLNELSSVKVGRHIRSKLRQLSESGFTFSEQQLSNICDLKWSKMTFKLSAPHPFAKIVDKSGFDTDFTKDKNGYNRYWNEIFNYGDVNLIFVSQWYEQNREYFDEWFSTLDINVQLKDDLKNNIGRKYDLLRQWLIKNGNLSICAPFHEIANLVGGLPPSAYKHRAFWSNTDSHPFSSSWLNAGYKVVDCDLQTQYVFFTKVGIENANVRTCKKTVKSALIEFSNNYKGQIKTSREIINELSSKYGHNEHSILPADYEIELKNGLPKLFRRIAYGTYECLGYNSSHTTLGTLDNTYSFVNDVDKEKVIKVIVTRFKNGFRNSSNIDFERFKNYYVDEYSEEFEYDAKWLNSLISAEAFIYDDRAYIYGKDVVDSVRLYLEQIDSPCIFIDAFFNKYSSEFYTFSIFSIDMLRVFIERNYKDISVKWDYIFMEENVSTYDLIKGVFSERETWSLDELQERLPYLKIATIRETMNSAEYFRVDKGNYTHIDNIDLPDGEGKKIRMLVENELLERDYVTANELDLSKLMNLNPHCSFYAVRDAVFYKFLSDSYDKNGQVITRRGVKLRALNIIEQYCRKADFASFDELNELEATFDPDGRTHSQCLIAGNSIMIRVSSELFVADSNVDFDVVKIDDALELYCHDNFIPLRHITDFSLFPFAGYSWNLFLLESYVRRFSRVFKFDVRAVNSANIGVIIRKSFDYNDYDDILALALSRSLVCLSDKKAVGDYLFKNGYIGWRNLGKSEDKIIRNAEVLREGVTV